jgi:hypothetical protein
MCGPGNRFSRPRDAQEVPGLHPESPLNAESDLACCAMRLLERDGIFFFTQSADSQEMVSDPEARSARWVANDALRELTSEKVRARLARRDS